LESNNILYGKSVAEAADPLARFAGRLPYWSCMALSMAAWLLLLWAKRDPTEDASTSFPRFIYALWSLVAMLAGGVALWMSSRAYGKRVLAFAVKRRMNRWLAARPGVEKYRGVVHDVAVDQREGPGVPGIRVKIEDGRLARLRSGQYLSMCHLKNGDLADWLPQQASSVVLYCEALSVSNADAGAAPLESDITPGLWGWPVLVAE
jgi:hypothetical protein